MPRPPDWEILVPVSPRKFEPLWIGQVAAVVLLLRQDVPGILQHRGLDERSLSGFSNP